MALPENHQEFGTEPPLLAEQCLAGFRAALLAGDNPQLERYLFRTDPDQHPLLFENLLTSELSYRQQRGEPISIEHYQRRFPGFASKIAEIANFVRDQAVRDSWVEPGPSDTTREYSPGDHARPLQPIPVFPAPPTASRGSPIPQPFAAAVPAAHPASPLSVPVAPVSKAQVASPQRVGKYRVESRLGGGGFGEVYLCYDPDLDDQVAVKVLRPEKHSQDLLEALRDEGRKSRQLEKRGARVVPVLETGTDQFGSPFMVMKYFSGGSLRDQIKARGTFRWQDAVALIDDLASTLAILHAEDIYHRDIKSQNILLDDRGRPYLADFGLASQISALEQDPSGHSPGYASPEQVLYGAARLDGRSDVYSLGVVFYELLTGKLPVDFKRGVRGDYERRVSDPGLVIPPVRQRQPTVPAPVAELCERCLVWDRAGRVQTAADLASQAAGLVVDSETVKPTRRGVVLWLTGGVVAAGFFSFSFLSRRRSQDRNIAELALGNPSPATVSSRWNSRLDEAVHYRTHTLDNPSFVGEPQASATEPGLMINTNSTLTYALGEVGGREEVTDFTVACKVTLTSGLGGLFLGRVLGVPPGDAVPPGTPLAYRFLGLLFERDEETGDVTARVRYVTLDQDAVQFEDDLASELLGRVGPIDVRIVVRGRRVTQISVNHKPIHGLNLGTIGERTPLNADLSRGSHHGVCAIRGAVIHFQDVSITN